MQIKCKRFIDDVTGEEPYELTRLKKGKIYLVLSYSQILCMEI